MCYVKPLVKFSILPFLPQPELKFILYEKCTFLKNRVTWLKTLLSKHSLDTETQSLMSKFLLNPKQMSSDYFQTRKRNPLKWMRIRIYISSETSSASTVLKWTVRSELVTSIERVHGLYFVSPNRHGNQLVLHKAWSQQTCNGIHSSKWVKALLKRKQSHCYGNKL